MRAALRVSQTDRPSASSVAQMHGHGGASRKGSAKNRLPPLTDFSSDTCGSMFSVRPPCSRFSQTPTVLASFCWHVGRSSPSLPPAPVPGPNRPLPAEGEMLERRKGFARWRIAGMDMRYAGSARKRQHGWQQAMVFMVFPPVGPRHLSGALTTGGRRWPMPHPVNMDMGWASGNH